MTTPPLHGTAIQTIQMTESLRFRATPDHRKRMQAPDPAGSMLARSARPRKRGPKAGARRRQRRRGGAQRSRLDRFGTAPDGRLFPGSPGATLSENTYGRAWQKARQEALTAAQTRSPLAERPYDLRHSGVTLQLNAGVPAPEIARRAGHGVAVLLRVYAGCIDGQEQLWNGRIDDALRDDEGS
jgi:integrase